MHNLRNVFSNGDRSLSKRRLVTSELRINPVSEDLKLPEIPQTPLQAIEYNIASEDSIVSS